MTKESKSPLQFGFNQIFIVEWLIYKIFSVILFHAVCYVQLLVKEQLTCGRWLNHSSQPRERWGYANQTLGWQSWSSHAHKNAFLRRDYMYQFVCNIPRIWMASSAICVAASAVYRITAAQSWKWIENYNQHLLSDNLHRCICWLYMYLMLKWMT